MRLYRQIMQTPVRLPQGFIAQIRAMALVDGYNLAKPGDPDDLREIGYRGLLASVYGRIQMPLDPAVCLSALHSDPTSGEKPSRLVPSMGFDTPTLKPTRQLAAPMLDAGLWLGAALGSLLPIAVPLT